MKRIGIVTGTRADYGLLSKTIKLLQDNSQFETRVFACGSHLSPEYGMTISELVADKVQNIIPLEILLSSNTRVGVAKSVGLATTSFADAFAREELSCLLVLGDRFEILAAVQTAMLLDIPIAHIHGGEVTEGAFDDSIRHSITKMSNIHFPATKEFADRIKQLGENDESVFIVGAPGIDNIVNGEMMSIDELERSLGFKLNQPLALVTYHPVTKTFDSRENDIEPLISAIKENPELTYIVTYPNADGGGKDIIEQWRTIDDFKNVHLVPSLGFQRYLSLMESVDCVIGNSSSGIIEAPSFKTGTVNIGSRQDRRPRASTVLDVQMDANQISNAIKICLSKDFKHEAKNCTNLYGSGGAAELIVKTLADIDFDIYRVKEFIDRFI